MRRSLPWILTIVLYAPAFRQLYTLGWETIDYTHAYFILPVALLITWTKRQELRYLATGDAGQKTPDVLCLGSHAPGLLLLSFGLAGFLFGWRWGYLLIQTLSLIPVLFGLCLFLYNKGLAKSLSFPILYLLLLMPIPVGILDNITLPMRYGASYLSTYILKALNYPAVREGLLINMNGHEIFMGAPCSGFRSLITMMSLGLVYIYFTCRCERGDEPRIKRDQFIRALILFIAIIPLALIGNLLRVITLCLITFHFGEKVGQGFFHYFSGAVVFVIIIFGLMGLEKLLRRKDERRPAAPPSSDNPTI